MGNGQGKGTRRHLYASGNLYDGEWARKQRHGRGRLEWTDGTVYEGEWMRNAMHGSGVMRFRNGNWFDGEFKNNNPDGQGTLHINSGEVISGQWTFRGRSITSKPIATYDLNVTVTDSKSGDASMYNGSGTLHLDTGLVVLPNMPSPEVAVLPYATAVLAENGKQIFGEAIGIAQPMRREESPQYALEAEMSVTPAVAAVAVEPGSADDQVLSASAVPRAQASSNGISFGVHDQALDQRADYKGPPKHKVELLDPRNYF